MFGLHHSKLFLYGILLLCICSWGFAVAGNRPEIIVVANKNREVHRTMLEAMQNELHKRGFHEIRVIRAARFSRMILSNNQGELPDLIISVGTDVTEEVAALNLSTPMLSVGIPRLSIEELQQLYAEPIKNGQHGSISAIYLDQPMSRRFNLIQRIFPDVKTAAMVLGPATQKYEMEFIAEAKLRKLDLHIGKVDKEENLIRTLDRVLENSEVMIGVVDPLVFNRTSARNVLLTAYRWRVPLFGISQAYVKSGSLASVYSTPEQIGQQLADTIVSVNKKPASTVPAMQYPKYFSVAVNYQVAESLGIQIDDEESLLEYLISQER